MNKWLKLPEFLKAPTHCIEIKHTRKWTPIPLPTITAPVGQLDQRQTKCWLEAGHGLQAPQGWGLETPGFKLN